MQLIENAKILHMDFLKHELEKLREGISMAIEIENTNILREDLLVDVTGPMYDVAYDLLSTVYITESLTVTNQNLIYDELCLYLDSEKYDNTDDFLKWLEEV